MADGEPVPELVEVAEAASDPTINSKPVASSTSSVSQITPNIDHTSADPVTSPRTLSTMPAFVQGFWLSSSQYAKRQKDILIPASIGAGVASTALIVGVRRFRQSRQPLPNTAASRAGLLRAGIWPGLRLVRKLPVPVLLLGTLGVGWQLGKWRGRWLA